MIKITFFIIFIFLITFTKGEEYKAYGSDHELVKLRGNFYIKNLEVFEIDENGEFGSVYIYKVVNEANLVEVAYNLKVGYYELKMANPLIQPFKLKKGDIIKVDLRNRLPKNFERSKVYVDIYKKRLFIPVEKDGKRFVITFPVGTGYEKYPTPLGSFKISEKKVSPDWIVPSSVRSENPKLPAVVPYGNPDNGLGTRALRLNGSSYMIHGTNKKSEKGVGMNISYGCVAMRNEDIERIFDIIDLGTEVIIYDSSKIDTPTF
ncbi:MAG: L,D-transpeptidase [Hydrogenothermaceae bacterium]|nr:L,D-transpeptidase [Hydrogenothermaceae bacterium]